MKRPILVWGRLCALLVPSLMWAPVSAQAPRRPEVWAIVIGVGRYDQKAIQGSTSAARDSLRVVQWLRQAGWDPRHQLLLSDFGSTDPGEPNAPERNIRPVRRNLEWALNEWLLPKVKSGDLVVFYFAGASRTVVKS
jgi:hypothetical protein